MAWHADIRTNAALGRVLGVSPQAIWKAARDGRITRPASGVWDAFAVLAEWRRNTHAGLQRPSGVFRPWLEPDLPLRGSIWREVVRRAEREGARVYYAEDRPTAVDDAADDELTL